MLPLSPAWIAALVAVGLALLQLLVARWRDLGPLTVAAVAVAFLLMDEAPDPRVLLASTVAVGVASVAWARGSRRGVGRPAVTAVVVAAAMAGHTARELLPGQVPLPDARLQQMVVVGVGFVGVVMGAVALTRARPGYPPPRWMGEIPVQGPRPSTQPGDA